MSKNLQRYPGLTQLAQRFSQIRVATDAINRVCTNVKSQKFRFFGLLTFERQFTQRRESPHVTGSPRQT
ncbi:hypothetical protein NIES3275_19430 [Microchaete diplosiphon NIES-3275]|nr:hypothetical protein NIES3275_19430 [Microchaete diplosiphon NIES-3275]